MNSLSHTLSLSLSKALINNVLQSGNRGLVALRNVKQDFAIDERKRVFTKELLCGTCFV